MMRKRLAGGLALLALLTLPLTAFAAYPPGSFPGPAPGGSYSTIVMSQTVCVAGGTMQASYSQSTLTLVIPAGAFKVCTQVSIYVAEPGVVSPLLPSGSNLVDGFAVGWEGSAPAAAPLTLTIVDAAITAGAQAFETSSGGLQPSAGATVGVGSVKVAFTTPVGIVVAVPTAPGSASPSPSGEVLGATGRPTTTPPATTTGPDVSKPPSDISGVAIALLLVTGLVAFILLRRRQRGHPDTTG